MHSPTPHEREDPPRPQPTPAYCALPEVAPRILPPSVDPGRAELIRLFANKWVNGTTLHYYFFDQPGDGTRVRAADGETWVPRTTSEAEKDVVRRAFALWKALDIGLDFREVSSRDEAEIRIGFMRGDGAWSYIGRDIIDLDIGRDERTMNFGGDLTRSPRELDTALHEIGHTPGFPHEHQNPHAGIVWNEDAVYAALAQPPNRWNRRKTHDNIIRKLSPDAVQGSTWDPDSVMHYPFGPGLILEPAAYRGGVMPAGGLSARDRTWATTFYPPLGEQDYQTLAPFESVKLRLRPGEQRNFVVQPEASREYTMRTFGISDTVLVLFEMVDGVPRFVSGDDDSGEERNALLHVRLRRERQYVLRVRLHHAGRLSETAVMFW